MKIKAESFQFGWNFLIILFPLKIHHIFYICIMACSKDFRSRVVEYILSGNRQVSASKIFKVHISTIRPWLALHKDSGSTVEVIARILNIHFVK